MYTGLALISLLSWGIGDAYATLSARRIGVFSTSVWNMFFGYFFSIFLIPFFISELAQMTLRIFLLNLVLGVVFAIGLVYFNKALATSNSAIAGSISASFTSLTVILSVIFFDDQLNFFSALCIFLIFLGIFILLFDFSVFLKLKKNTKGIFFAFVPLLCWGTYYAFIKIPVEAVGWFWPQVITLSLFPLLIFFEKFRGRKSNLRKPGIPAVLNGVLVAIGEFSYNAAISFGPTAIVAPIAGSYPVLFIIIVSCFLKEEKLDKQQIIAIFMVLSGIVSLTLSN